MGEKLQWTGIKSFNRENNLRAVREKVSIDEGGSFNGHEKNLQTVEIAATVIAGSWNRGVRCWNLGGKMLEARSCRR